MEASTAIQEKVQDVVYRALESFGAEPTEISREASLEGLDIDSLDLAELSQIAEDEFGVKLTASDADQLQTVGQAIDLIAERAS